MLKFIKSLDINGKVSRIKKRSIKENFGLLIGLNERTSKIALSISIGMFVGFTVPMGLETIVAVLLSLIFRCNPVFAVITTWVTNPLTILPIYYVGLKVGEFITNSYIPWEKIEFALKHPTLHNLLTLGKDGFILITIGNIVVGLVVAILTYLLVFNFISFYRKKYGIMH
jgi:uncharacterized protein (DUF2062 family)